MLHRKNLQDPEVDMHQGDEQADHRDGQLPQDECAVADVQQQRHQWIDFRAAPGKDLKCQDGVGGAQADDGQHRAPTQLS